MLNYAAAFENTAALSLGTCRLSPAMPLSQVTCHLPIDDRAVAVDFARANYRTALKAWEYGAYDGVDHDLRVAGARLAELGLEHWEDCEGCSVDVHGGFGYCEDCQDAPFDSLAMRRMTLAEELSYVAEPCECGCQEDAA